MPVAILAHPVLAVIGAQVSLVREVVEGAESFVRDEHDVTAAPAVPSRGAAEGHVLFTAKRHAAAAAVCRPRLEPHTRR